MKSIEAIENKFESGNSIPCEFARVYLAEWEAIVAEVAKLEADVPSPDWDDYSPQAIAAAQRYSRLSDELREMQRKAAPIPHYNFYVKGAQA